MKSKKLRTSPNKSLKKDSPIKMFLEDNNALGKILVSKKYENLVLPEYPFDRQALAKSAIYRKSRELYVSNGGTFSPKISSVVRSLSAQDLFKNYIEFSPIQTELEWFIDIGQYEVTSSAQHLQMLLELNGISLFHEQNHRIVWQNLPPAPTERLDLCRYLNFAESLVVALDLALADQIGKKLSPIFERMKILYRTAGEDSQVLGSKKSYRQYLYANIAATYFRLELYEPKDIRKGLSFIFPKQKQLVSDVIKRSLDLSNLFVTSTNPIWQDRSWQQAKSSLEEMHNGSAELVLYLPDDPLAFGEDEFSIANKIFALFGL